MDEAAAMVRLGLEQRVTGRERRHRKSLEQQMQGAVEHREYEKAAQLRDQLGQLGQELQQRCRQRGTPVVERKHIGQVVAQRTGIPTEEVLEQADNRLMGLEQQLGCQVLGQKRAAEEISRTLLRSRMGLGGAQRPRGSFLFAGAHRGGENGDVPCAGQRALWKPKRNDTAGHDGAQREKRYGDP